MTAFIGPDDSLNDSINPSHADCSSLMEPSTVLILSSAVVFRIPPTSSSESRSSRAASAPSRNVLNADTDLLSVSSRVVLRSTPCAFKVLRPAISSGNVLTGFPRATASFPLESARFSRIFLVAVAAEEASKPAFASVPSSATVSLKEKQNVLATGPTVAIAVW